VRRHGARRTVQVLVLAGGVLTPWTGLFRLDLPGNQVMYLGRAYPLGWPYILGLIVPFVTLVWALAFLAWRQGRVFCGWACPYGTLVEAFEAIGTALGRGSHRRVAAWMRRGPLPRWLLRGGAVLAMTGVPLIMGASLATYLVPPGRVLHDLLRPLVFSDTTQVTLWAWMALVLAGSWAAGFAVRFHFCRMVCIYGMGQAMAASAAEPSRVLKPRYRAEDLSACGSCQACLKACFLDLDPRKEPLVLGFSQGCFNCGDCLDVCETVQAHRGAPSLLTFRRPGAPPRQPRREDPEDWT